MVQQIEAMQHLKSIHEYLLKAGQKCQKQIFQASTFGKME